MNSEWTWMALCVLSMLAVTAMSFWQPEPMTQAQINAAFAKQVQR